MGAEAHSALPATLKAYPRCGLANVAKSGRNAPYTPWDPDLHIATRGSKRTVAARDEIATTLLSQHRPERGAKVKRLLTRREHEQKRSVPVDVPQCNLAFSVTLETCPPPPNLGYARVC